MLSLQPGAGCAGWPGDAGTSLPGQRVEQCCKMLKMPAHHQSLSLDLDGNQQVFSFGDHSTAIGMAYR